MPGLGIFFFSLSISHLLARLKGMQIPSQQDFAGKILHHVVGMYVFLIALFPAFQIVQCSKHLYIALENCILNIL